ncbi:Hypothetical predicted protein, partial [Paramuricea clavata]
MQLPDKYKENVYVSSAGSLSGVSNRSEPSSDRDTSVSNQERLRKMQHKVLCTRSSGDRLSCHSCSVLKFCSSVVVPV